MFIRLPYVRSIGILATVLCTACGAQPAHRASSAPPITDAARFVTALEDRLRDASTIAIDAQIEAEGTTGLREIAFSLDADRARWHLRGVRDGAPRSLELDSDLATTRIRDDEGETHTLPTMTDQRDFLAIGLVRAGLSTTAAWTMTGQALRDFSDGRPCCWAELEDVRLGAPEALDGTTVDVVHARMGAFGQPRGELTLFIDRARGVPVRREMSVPGEGTEARVVERYSRFDVVP